MTDSQLVSDTFAALERLGSAEAALQEALRLVQVQETEIGRTIKASRAGALLRAYKEGARLAGEQVVLVRRGLC
jgi:hypothetical protein